MMTLLSNLQEIVELINSIYLLFENTFSWLAILASFFSTIIALWTLFEMKKQRNNAYQPDIVFCNLRLFVDTGITEVEGINVKENRFIFVPAGEKWDIGNNTEKTTIKLSNFLRKEIYINISAYNTGVGVCKNLICTYSLHSYLKWFDFLIKNDIIRKSNTVRNSWESCNSDMDIGEFGISTDKTVIRENFIIPNCQNKYYFKLPFEYILFLMSINNMRDFDKISDKEFPPINANLEYRDVQGKKYKRKIKIKITPFSTTVSKNNSIVFIYDITTE